MPQLWPQPPQLFTSVVVSEQVSPQCVSVPEQMQSPAVHVLEGGQTVPHVPQLLVSVCTSTHDALHAVLPPGQKHTPAVHADPIGQTLPHVPQSSVLVIVFTQCAGVPHASSPVLHEVHAPSTHTPPVPQFV